MTLQMNVIVLIHKDDAQNKRHYVYTYTMAGETMTLQGSVIVTINFFLVVVLFFLPM